MDSKIYPSQRRISDWSNLMPEILDLIVRKMTHVCDYVRFRSICTSWRQVASEIEFRPPPPIPWLVSSCSRDYLSNTVSFFNVSDRMGICSFDLPEASKKLIYGSPHGLLWLIGNQLYDPALRRQVSLLNPITRAHTPLPELPKELNTESIKKVILCSHPAKAQPSQLLAIVFTLNTLSFIRQGDNTWTQLTGKLMQQDTIPHAAIEDIVYFDNKLYVLCKPGWLAVLTDDPRPSFTILIHPLRVDVPDSVCVRLVEAAGDLLMLTWYYEGRRSVYSLKINICILYRTPNKNLEWLSIGVVNVAEIQSYSYPIHSVCSVYVRALPNCNGYRIYLSFLKSPDDFHIQEINVLSSDDNVAVSYDVPKRWSQRHWTWAGITWFVPSLD